MAVTHRMSRTPEWTAWKNMLSRCFNPNLPNYHNYGGRGITVCPEWRDSFEKFYEHIGPRPSARHSLDRIKNEKGYEPGNVRWATDIEQLQNTRHNVYYTASGETLCINEWARRAGVDPKTIARRIQAGWTEEEVISPHQRIRRGTQCYQAKLNEDNVRQIRARLSAGVPANRLAKSFNVTPKAIIAIKHGKTWKHVA